jgi:hypothetical protein
MVIEPVDDGWPDYEEPFIDVPTRDCMERVLVATGKISETP